MSQPVDTVLKLLSSMGDADALRTLIHPNATYISLAFSNPDLQRIMPWVGEYPGAGPEQYISTFSRVASYWDSRDFSIDDSFGQGESVAVFGRMTLASKTLGRAYHTPFAVHAKVKDGLVTYMLFMEDTFGTASTFWKEGEVVFVPNPATKEEVKVTSPGC